MKHEQQLDYLLKTVCLEFNVSPDEVKSRCRLRKLVVPRHVFLYAAATLFNKCVEGDKTSIASIGRLIDRDHSSVIHAMHTVRDEMDTNKVFRDRIENLMADLNGIDLNGSIPDRICAIRLKIIMLEQELLKLEERQRNIYAADKSRQHAA